MSHRLTAHRLIRGALTGAALTCVLLLGLAGGLHVHEPHPGESCDFCLQLDHFGLDLPPLVLEDTIESLGRVSAQSCSTEGDHTGSRNDPARAPPFLS